MKGTEFCYEQDSVFLWFFLKNEKREDYILYIVV